MSRNIDIEALCADKGLRITEQRKTISVGALTPQRIGVDMRKP